MATAREILELIITGNGQGAIAEMDRVAARSKSSLGSTERDLDALGNKALRFGVVATTAGVVAGAGLYSVAQGAGTLATDLERIRGNLGDASTEAIAFVENANDIGLSDRAAASAVATIGELAVGLGIAKDKSAEYTVETVSLISQLATLKGFAPQHGLDAINASLIGEFDSLQKLVPEINAAAIQNRALADTGKTSAKELTAAEKATATFEIVLNSARSTMSRAGDAAENNAMKNARLAASWDDMKTSIGEEALPAIEAAVTGGTAAIETFRGLDDSLDGIPSRLIVVATGATLVTGALALMSAGVIKANAALRTSEGSLNRWGIAAKGAGAAIAVLATTDAVFSLINNTDGRAQAATDSINQLVLATKGLGDVDTLKAFEKGVRNENDTLKFSHIWEGFGAEIDLGTGVKADIEVVQAYFDKLRQSSPEAATVTLDALERTTAGLDENSGQFRTNSEFIDKNRGSLKLAADAAAANSKEADGAAESNNKVGAAAESASRGLDRSAYSFRAAGDAAAGSKSDVLQYADALSAAFDPVLGLMDANDRLADAQERMAEAADTNGRDVVEATRNLTDAQANLNKVLKDDPLFGLRQVSPEVDLADARNRLADANRRLAANPRDAEALTARDEAVTDLEAASKRAQDLKRQGAQRADAIESAQRQVSDAQQRLTEVQSEHGTNSKAYRDAAGEVIRANVDVEKSLAVLADAQINGQDAIGETIGKLDEWIAMGGPLGAAAQQMKDQIGGLTWQVLGLAGAMDGVAGSTQSMIDQMIAWGKSGAPSMIDQMTAWASSGGPSGPSMIDRMTGWGEQGKAQNKPLVGIDMNPGGGIDGNVWTPFALGGTVPGSGFRDTVPAMLTPGEEVLNRNEAAVYRAGRRASQVVANQPQYVLAGSGSSSTTNDNRREGDLNINAPIRMVVDDPGAAGVAVQNVLADIAYMSGRGLRAGSRLRS